MRTLGACVAVAGLILSGCMKADTYQVGWLYSENVHTKLDASWFIREIKDRKGTAALELVYCPIQPEQSIVCRTSIVWERDARHLVEHPRLGPSPASTDSR